MKLFFPRFLLLAWGSLILASQSPAAPTPPGQPGVVTYNPQSATVQGNQPLTASYVLTITSPANLKYNTSVNVSLGLGVLAKPLTGVTDATALTFISLSPANLTFTGPGQQMTTNVTVVVPQGNYAGDYAYQITSSGWPANVGVITDNGATVNARVSPPNSTDTAPPAVTLLAPLDGSVYTYAPASGIPVTVPVSFTASVGTNGEPIDGMQAFINDTPVILSTTGLLTRSASATGSVQLTSPGIYTVSVSATNRNGTSRASADVSVSVDAPPPTITASSPTSNSVFSFNLGDAGATVPVSFSATSVYGNITSLAATLDGSPVILNLSGVGAATSASGSALLTIETPGSHTLVISASNEYGAATPVTIPFTVTSVTPVPTVLILSPANGSGFSRLAGDPDTVVNFSFQGGTSYGTIASVIVTLDGNPMPATVNGLNTASITGSGAMNFSAGGSHTLNVTVSNGGAAASASTSFTVTETPTQACCEVFWLPPISLNQTVKGGSTMPIKFTLRCCDGGLERDTAVVVAIHEVYANGSISSPVMYPHGTGSPNAADYSITGGQYHLNFRTANGTHSYRVEVYSFATGSAQLLGSRQLNTK